MPFVAYFRTLLKLFLLFPKIYSASFFKTACNHLHTASHLKSPFLSFLLRSHLSLLVCITLAKRSGALNIPPTFFCIQHILLHPTIKSYIIYQAHLISSWPLTPVNYLVLMNVSSKNIFLAAPMLTNQYFKGNDQ